MPVPSIPSRLFKKALGLICLAIILGMLAVALWPLNPFPRNRVSWLFNQDGLRFADGIVFSAADFPGPPPAPSAAGASARHRVYSRDLAPTDYQIPG